MVLAVLCVLLPFLMYADMALRRRSPGRGGTLSSPPAETSDSLEDTSELPFQETSEVSEEMLGKQEFLRRNASIIEVYDIHPEKVSMLRWETTKRYKSVSLSDVDLYRFLIARKGNFLDAREMLCNSLQWRLENFPIKLAMIRSPLQTKCIFFHGKAKDGSPVMHFRNALYNKDAGTPSQYTLAIAYAIDYILQRSPLAFSIVVFVHTSHVEGAVNGPADFSFIKPFMKTFSDNYPERLNTLIMYPFPWYGRASWSVVRMFLDRRTQDKVRLLPGLASDQGFRLPDEVYEVIDREEIPQCCGGGSSRPIEHLIDTLPEDD